MARLRLWGDLSADGRDTMTVRWYNSMPAVQAAATLTGFGGMSEADARAAVKVRPAGTAADLPEPHPHGPDTLTRVVIPGTASRRFRHAESRFR